MKVTSGYFLLTTKYHALHVKCLGTPPFHVKNTPTTQKTNKQQTQQIEQTTQAYQQSQ